MKEMPLAAILIGVDHSVEPLLFAVYFDLSLVNRDPRRFHRWRVALCFRQYMNTVPDRTVLGIDAQ